jgi:hypothetical protein
MIDPEPVVLEGYGVRLEPLDPAHADALVAAAADGDLWKLWYVAVADLVPGRAAHWMDAALAGQRAGTMLPWVFDRLGCKVVGFRVDNLNERSQAAMDALGAHKDGVLRHFQARPDGTPRDTHVYSIVAGEWPSVRLRLEERLRTHRDR